MIVNNISTDMLRCRALKQARSPQSAHRRQALSDRCDALDDACGGLARAMDALDSCRESEDGAEAELINTLEDICADLRRRLERAHAQLERLDASEEAALTREYLREIL